MTQSKQAPYADRPAWYRGLKTRHIGAYFGSVSSIAPDETYVTMDRKYIVYRDPEHNRFSVSRNACAHAGAMLLSTPGVQAETHKVLRCPIHKWTYAPTGELKIAPFFENCKNIRLHAPTFGVWNGYVLGNEQQDLDIGMMGFGRSLGIPQSAFDPAEFVFMGEEGVALPYPRELMMVNYFDGYHVPLYHHQTFAAVADEKSYAWELSTDHLTSTVGYSLQLVRSRPAAEVRARLQTFLQRDVPEEKVGWASFHLWLQDEIVKHDIKTPLDPSIFALWASIYGDGYLMPELYAGGLFLAVSYLVNVDPKNPETGNENYVEYYVHKNVPESLRNEAMRRFKDAYDQSAREDDEICIKLWDAHQQGDMDFARHYHVPLEDGDRHWREWFNAQFELK